MKQLEGGWILVAKEHDGKKAEYPQGVGVILGVSDGQFRLMMGAINPLGKDGGMGNTIIFTPRLDPEQRPKTIDLGYEDPKKEPWLRGIYKVEGDRLIICWGETDKERPTDFTAKPKSGRTLTVFKRADSKP